MRITNTQETKSCSSQISYSVRTFTQTSTFDILEVEIFAVWKQVQHRCWLYTDILSDQKVVSTSCTSSECVNFVEEIAHLVQREESFLQNYIVLFVRCNQGWIQGINRVQGFSSFHAKFNFRPPGWREAP